MTHIARDESLPVGGAERAGGARPGGSPAPAAAPALSGLKPPPASESGSAEPWRRGLDGYVFLLPYLLLLGTFLILPLAWGFWLSFTDYQMTSPEQPGFAGLSNYEAALTSGELWQAAGATALFVVLAVPLTVGAALVLALGVEAVGGKLGEFYKVSIFLPTMLTISVAGLLWRWFYEGEFGLFNALLAPLNIKVPWLTSATLAMPSVALMTLWWTVGGPMIILVAGLRQIPDVYYEAASLDGATGVRRLWSITLPLLRPVLLFVLVINVIGAFQVFGQTFIITRGGPVRATRVLMQYIYETSFQHYRLGYGAAMSWLLFVAIAVFSLIQFRVLRER